MGGFESYRHSGRIEFNTIPVTLCGGLIAGVAVSWFYQLTLDWIENTYVSLFATAAVGGILGATIGKLLRWSNCRNTTVAALLAIGVLGASLFLSHFWAYHRMLGTVAARNGLKVEMARLIYTPQRFLQDKLKTGWLVWGIRVTGSWVYVVWVAEALAILLIGTVAANGATDLPFCEDCEQWTVEREVGAKRSVPIEIVQQAVTLGSIDVLVQAPQVPGGPDELLVFKLHSCETCLQRAFLTVSRCWQEISGKGEVTSRRQDVAVQVPVTQKQLDLLRFSLKRGPPSPPPPELEVG
jgi:hypothetical protein